MNNKTSESTVSAPAAALLFAMTPEQIGSLAEEGFRFILPGVDLIFLRLSAAQTLATARAAVG